MGKVVSLVDQDIVIVKSQFNNEEVINKQEEKLTEKLGKKVVILPAGFEIVNYQDHNNKTIINSFESNSIDIATINLNEIDPWEDLKHALENGTKSPHEWDEIIKAVAKKIQQEDKQKEYRLLNKEEYERLMSYRSRKSNEERWNRLSKGNKYIVYAETGDMGIQLYSLDTFYNKPILSCNK